MTFECFNTNNIYSIIYFPTQLLPNQTWYIANTLLRFLSSRRGFEEVLATVVLNENEMFRNVTFVREGVNYGVTAAFSSRFVVTNRLIVV